MYKLILLVLFLCLASAHGMLISKSMFKTSNIFPSLRNAIRKPFKSEKTTGNKIDTPETSRSSVAFPKQDLTQGLSLSVNYLPLILEKDQTGYSYLTKIDQDLVKGKPTESSLRKVAFLCPDKSKVQDGCLMRKPVTEELPRCNVQPTPIIKKVMKFDSAEFQEAGGAVSETTPQEDIFYHASCGSNEQDEKFLYLVAYEICKGDASRQITKENQSDDEDAESYVFCYDHKNKETVYTQHSIFSAQLLDNDLLKSEREVKFDMSTEDFGYFDDIFKQMKEIYYEASRSDIGSSYKPQNLVPADDFSFAVWRMPTFHYLNIKPQHEKLLGLWNYIGQLIRNEAKKHNIWFDIITGTVNVPEIELEQQFLYNNEIQIPEIWVKLAYFQFPYNGEMCGLAIVMSNCLVEDGTVASAKISAKLKEYCPVDLCDISNRKEVFNEYSSLGDNARCCEVTKQILDIFDLDLSIDRKALIEGLVDSKYAE